MNLENANQPLSANSGFQHAQSAHCETGVVNSLFQSNGIPLSEPMALGIGSGLLFVFIPFVKVMGNPLVSYRAFPGTIFKKCGKRIGVDFKLEKFSDRQKGIDRLDELLEKQIPVGVQTNIFWLPYIPEKFRFHFNAHNLIVLEKQKDNYLVSDPIVESLELCPTKALTKARFSQGPLAPKGLIYYVTKVGEIKNLEIAIKKGIKETVRAMLYTPLPIVGIKGMRLLSRHIKKWPKKLGEKQARVFLSSVIRMQEEIGTGGAGFRYMYAAFLNESAKKLNNPILLEASLMMEAVADSWRDFAILSVGLCKERNNATFDEVAEKLLTTAKLEEEVFRFLKDKYL
jgi:hypothetical protein